MWWKEVIVASIIILTSIFVATASIAIHEGVHVLQSYADPDIVFDRVIYFPDKSATNITFFFLPAAAMTINKHNTTNITRIKEINSRMEKETIYKEAEAFIFQTIFVLLSIIILMELFINFIIDKVYGYKERQE